MDRFLKVMLVVIACLLILNLIKTTSSEIANSFLETRIKADTPTFIQVNKTYNCNVSDRPSQNYEIKQIDKVNGWIEAKWSFEFSGTEGIRWFNLTHFQSCSEVKTQPIKLDK